MNQVLQNPMVVGGAVYAFLSAAVLLTKLFAHPNTVAYKVADKLGAVAFDFAKLFGLEKSADQPPAGQ